MNDSTKMYLGLVLGIVLSTLDAVLLILGMVSLWLFVTLLVVSIAVMFLPMVAMKGDWVFLEADGIRIDAPFAKKTVPFRSITGVEMVTGFKPGIKTFGYGGIKRGAGEFMNDTLGAYTFAGNTAVDRMIIVRYRDGKSKLIAFNLPSVERTEEFFSAISGDSPAKSPIVLHSETESNRKRYRNLKRTYCAILGISLAAVVVIVALAMTVGHADACLDDDGLVIDATGMHRTIAYEDISGAELRYDVDYGIRVGGIANSKVYTGNFRNDEFGDYNLSANKGVDYCIVVYNSGKTMVFNLGTDAETQTFFAELQSKLGGLGTVVYKNHLSGYPI